VSKQQQITILGATGSIGTQVLDIVNSHSDKYQIYALTAGQNIKLLAQQCKQFKPQYAVIADCQLASELAQLLSGTSTAVLAGKDALNEIAASSTADIIVAAIVGSAGLLPSLAALTTGKRVLLANKEALVMAGSIFMQTATEHGTQLLPIDSEHNGIFQCLPADYLAAGKERSRDAITKLVLTASGGPFLNMPLAQLAQVTPAQACSHPNWDMGNKICVDSATMMNKGLELIEAHWLFDMPLTQLDAIIHPQSLVHALVYYTDGSVLAHAGCADMRIPISNALAWPQRLALDIPHLDLIASATLEFSAIDEDKFICFSLAKQALAAGGTAGCILNAANEVANEAFLDGKLAFTAIAHVVEQVLTNLTASNANSLEAVLETDKQARIHAQQFSQQYAL
jgi:1-deoxy-D-xylulose-5-phosphate reductoisomerase